MSVIITLKLKGDSSRFEEYAAANADKLRAIAAEAKAAGVIGHRFYGSEGNQVMVIDEWPDAESFHGFFDGQADVIGPMMGEAGFQGEPEITVWRELDTPDKVGWD
jgi:heme-degrading monooxygenase HmoA